MAKGEEAGLSDSITSQAAVLAEWVAAFLDRSLRTSGLTLGAFELLSAVKASPAGTQAALAQRLGITPSSLCEAVRAAVKKGLLEQELSSKDRRAKRLVLTGKGDRVLSDAIATLHEAEQLATQSLSAGQIAGAIETLRKASKSLSQAASAS